jgi:hypothetical protein
MSDRINLEQRASDMLAEIAGDKFDADEIRDGLSERAHEEADNACIYYHHAQTIIQDYESQSGLNESDLGGEYRADQWQEAMTAWAYEIACAVLTEESEKALKAVEEHADALCDAVADHDDNEAPDPDDLRVSIDCPHGWAAHDKENAVGICYWISRQLDGCNALAVDVGPFWLSYTWEPEQEDEDEADD